MKNILLLSILAIGSAAAEWKPKPGDRVVSSYGAAEFITVVDRVEYVGPRSQTGILVYGFGLPGIDSFWVRPAPPENNFVILSGEYATNGRPSFILREFLVTNSVEIGSATIGENSFSLVALRQDTNRVVRYENPIGGAVEWWTNRYLGPFVATNFVPLPPHNATNVTMKWGEIIITPNLLLR